MKIFSSSVSIFVLLLTFFFAPRPALAQFGGDLGSVSGSVKWGSENVAARILFRGDTTGFTLGRNPASPNYDTGFNLPADTYTVKVFLLHNENTRDIAEVVSRTVTVAAGQSITNFDFDVSTASALVKGNLKVNGQLAGGNLQFCSPVNIDPCPSPVNLDIGPLFSFGTGGFSVAIPPGSYRMHATTSNGVNVGIVPITVAAGQLISDSSTQFALDLGSVSGTVKWGNETINARILFKGDTTGFTLGRNPASPNYDTGFNLPPDTYTVKVFLLQSSDNATISELPSQTVTVANGQSVTNFNFDASTASGLVKGNLKVNGTLAGGNLQFCSPIATDPCPSPVSSGQGSIFSFGTEGFTAAIPPGSYRAHVTTTSGIDAGIVSITVAAGQVLEGESMNYELNLGRVSGAVLWGTQTISARVSFKGNTSGLTFRGNPDGSSSSPSYDTGFNLPTDTYTATIFLRQNSNTQDIAQIGTAQVTVVSGQTTTFNFDASTASGLVVGNLTVNGQPAAGNLQFCSPVTTDPCPSPVSEGVGPLFSFASSGFVVALPSGSYRAHVTTTQGVNMGIIPITITNGQIVNFDFSDVTPTPTPTSTPIPTNTPTPTNTPIPTPTPVNQNPQVSTLMNATMDSGDTYSVNGSFIDNDSTSWTATVNYGDGSGVQPLVLSDKNFVLSHLYSTPGQHIVAVVVTDNQGAIGTATATITVNNRPPHVNPISEASINTGAIYSKLGSFTDSDSASWTATVDYGDGGDTESLSLNPDKTFSLNHQYTTAGTYTVTVVVRDDAQATGTTMATVIVNAPVAPELAPLTSAMLPEGSTYAVSGSFADADSSSWTATVDYGDGSGVNPLTLNADKTYSLSHVYSDNGSYTLTVVVTDNEGLSDTGNAIVNVNNLSPLVGSITAPTNPVQVNAAINVSAAFTDAGVLDSHTAVWDWGDGTTNNATLTESNGSGSVSGTHVYTTPGVYTVTLTVTDNSSESSTQTFQYITVYNPNAGWASGGKEFISPVGAIPGNAGATGKADFGFQVKYLNGDLVPSGKNFSLSFPAGNIQFSSTAYQWLVVDGDKATFKADGTLNGLPGYTVLVSVIEQTSGDGFIRVQIKASSNNVVYDTQPGAGDIADPATIVTKGKIAIH